MALAMGRDDLEVILDILEGDERVNQQFVAAVKQHVQQHEMICKDCVNDTAVLTKDPFSL